MTQLDALISEIQSIALALGTQHDPAERKILLTRLREVSWATTTEIILTQPITHRQPKAGGKFGVDDL